MRIPKGFREDWYSSCFFSEKCSFSQHTAVPLSSRRGAGWLYKTKWVEVWIKQKPFASEVIQRINHKVIFTSRNKRAVQEGV